MNYCSISAVFAPIGFKFGMEIEHSNDTAGVVNAANQKTLNIASTQIFMDKNIRDNGQIRSQAFKKMWTLLFYAQNTVYLQNYI